MATTPFSVCKEFCAGGGGTSNAKDVEYDNTNSGLIADDVGGAIDELSNKIVDTNGRLMEKESILNKVTDINYNINNSSYPTTKAVKDYVDSNLTNESKLKEDVSNKTDDIENGQGDMLYPTANAVKKYVAKNTTNILKGFASGNPVVLTDVSPNEHEITVTEPIGGMDVLRAGKNQFNGNLVKGAWLYEKGNYSASAGGYVTCAEKIPIMGGEKYTLSFTANKGNMNGVVFYDFDGNVIRGDSTIRANPYTFTAPDDAGYMCFNLYSSGLTVEDIKTVQLEFGNASEYEPYVEPIWYFSDDEPLKIPSLYPTTVIYAINGGVAVTAEYNRDINKVIANLENALLSLGGNI